MTLTVVLLCAALLWLAILVIRWTTRPNVVVGPDGELYFEGFSPRLVETRARLQAVVDAVDSELLSKRWDNVVVGDVDPSREVDAGYIMDLTQMRLCTKNSKDNDLVHVGLHELSHLMTNDWMSHGDVFQANFAKVVDTATNIGVYSRDDYVANPRKVCGVWL
jgi:hypothetical protein